jgi:predicted Zn-dependent protease
MRKQRMRSVFLLLLFCLNTSSIHARVNIKPGFNSFSPQQDVELGKQAAQQVEKQYPVVSDPQMSDYINRLGRRLSSYAPGYKFPYQFHLVNVKQINAFALPGGQVYVHTATVAAAANEAQLAGVMAHEISHVALRHSTNQASKAMLAQAPLAILGGVLSGGGIGAQLAQLGISFGVNSAFLKFSRSAESQADELGAQIMYDAGYDPRAMAQFFETIQRQGGNQSLEFLSDHPNPGNRIGDVDRLIPQLGPSKAFSAGTGEFEEFKRRAAGIAPSSPSTRRQFGTTEQLQEPPAPSRSLRSLSANFFSNDYPDSWQIYGQETDAITLVPPSGILQSDPGSLPAIARGLVASLFQASPPPAGGSPLRMRPIN